MVKSRVEALIRFDYAVCSYANPCPSLAVDSIDICTGTGTGNSVWAGIVTCIGIFIVLIEVVRYMVRGSILLRHSVRYVALTVAIIFFCKRIRGRMRYYRIGYHTNG